VEEWRGQEADYSSLSKAKNEWSFISASLLCLHSLQRDKFRLIAATGFCYSLFHCPSEIESLHDNWHQLMSKIFEVGSSVS